MIDEPGRDRGEEEDEDASVWAEILCGYSSGGAANISLVSRLWNRVFIILYPHKQEGVRMTTFTQLPCGLQLTKTLGLDPGKWDTNKSSGAGCLRGSGARCAVQPAPKVFA